MPTEITANCYHCALWQPNSNGDIKRVEAFKNGDFFTHPGPPGDCIAIKIPESLVANMSKKPSSYRTKPGQVCNVLINGRQAFTSHPAIDLNKYANHLSSHASKQDDGAGI
jgi:hypothetical protein